MAQGNETKKPFGGVLRFGCCGFRHQQKEIIAKDKAKAGTKAIKHALRVQGVMRALELGVVADFLNGIAVFKRRIDKEEIARLIEAGKFDDAVAMIPWDKLPDDVAKIDEKFAKAMDGSAEVAIQTLPGPKSTLVVGTANPRVRRFISDQVGNLVQNVTSDGRRAVQNTVRAALDQGLTPRRAADLMGRSVGLTEKQNVRVMNRQLKEFQRRDELQTQLEELQSRGKGGTATAQRLRRNIANLSDSKIEKRADKMARSLEKQRAVTIARTELTRATNEGQIMAWEQAAEDGLIDRQKARKVWVVVPDDRLSNICADLDGKSVGMDEMFTVAQTGESVSGPPAHPNCRSAIALKFEDE